jgi:glycosyltransferase involved in cell wall biosynthesis
MIGSQYIPNDSATTFITCVSDWKMYESCVVSSLEQMNSSQEKIEQVPINNKDNQFSASQALNIGLEKASGDFIIFCHQDVVFPQHWLSKLFRRIEELEQYVTSWGVIGFAGRCADGSQSGHIEDPRGEFFHPPLPRQVQTLDELCLVIRKDSGLRFDEYFNNFHLYGADLCLTAICRDMACFTIDCCMEHRSKGNKSPEWHIQKEKLIEKWWPQRRLVGRKIYTTSGSIRLHSPAVRFIRRICSRLKLNKGLD